MAVQKIKNLRAVTVKMKKNGLVLKQTLNNEEIAARWIKLAEKNGYEVIA